MNLVEKKPNQTGAFKSELKANALSKLFCCRKKFKDTYPKYLRNDMILFALGIAVTDLLLASPKMPRIKEDNYPSLDHSLL